jgi:hypothetical protein
MEINNAEQNLKNIIENSQFLDESEKSIILGELGKYSPLEKLKLRKDLLQNIIPVEIVRLRQTKNQFIESEKPKKPDFITKITQQISPPKKPEIQSKSVLQKPNYIGKIEPKGSNSSPVNLSSLVNFNNLHNLNSLTPSHINFNINENADQIVNSFLSKITELFVPIENIQEKRIFLLNFLQSPLFGSYLNTGITAVRHPEIQPSKVVLNTLHHIDEKYLNNKQFAIAAKISAHIRSITAI